jgi:hypothetical protein
MRAALVAGVVVLLVAPGFAQQSYVPPRASDGHADIGGVWSNGGSPVTISQTVDGVVHSAPFEDPVDAKLPLRDPAAALTWRQKYGTYMSGKPQLDFTLGPDTMPNRDRCLMAANAAAPPMTSQGYNDAYQIVQTPGHVVIGVEMMDETRIVRVFGSADEAMKAHGPQVLQRWTGDSVGWWEEDTFVVETANVSPRQGSESPMPTSREAKVTERFTRVGAEELAYQAEVSDPALYTAQWSIRYSFHPGERLWEYACHEGNYGMAGILSGAREAERLAK